MTPVEYRTLFLRKINRKKIITGVLLGLFIVIVATFVIVYTFFSEQLQLPDYSYVVPLFMIQLAILITVLFQSISFFRSYEKVLFSMNDEDLETLKKISESRSWLDRYLPSFIIYSGKIKVFKWLGKSEFYFKELKEIKIKTSVFTRGRQNRLVIFSKVDGGTFFFAMDNNTVQRKHLLEKAVAYNPNIIIEGGMH